MVRICTFALLVGFAVSSLSQSTAAKHLLAGHAFHTTTVAVSQHSATTRSIPVHASLHNTVKRRPARAQQTANGHMPEPSASGESHASAPLGNKMPMDLTNVTAAESPVSELSGRARMLIIFAPDAKGKEVKDQMRYIEHHQTELTDRDMVVVPVISTGSMSENAFAGENLPADNPREEAATRNLLHVAPGEFAVIYVGMDGREAFRSASPLNIGDLLSRIDSSDPKAMRTVMR